jgi:hypothetical protein
VAQKQEHILGIVRKIPFIKVLDILLEVAAQGIESGLIEKDNVFIGHRCREMMVLIRDPGRGGAVHGKRFRLVAGSDRQDSGEGQDGYEVSASHILTVAWAKLAIFL